jgi:hypothetical protein
LVILCETNVLNLISQRLDTICQIKPKRATVFFFTPFYTTKHSRSGVRLPSQITSLQTPVQGGRMPTSTPTTRRPVEKGAYIYIDCT